MDAVGFVGVGAMGLELLVRMCGSGASVVAYDKMPEAREKARAAGADVVDSPAAVGRAATIVDVIVRTDEDVLDALLGPDGLIEGTRPGTLVLLHSTVNPATTKRVAEAAAAKGVDLIDACMVGMPRIARGGNEIFLLGGPEHLVARARPHLLRMGEEVLHMGPLGAGNAAKIIKNLTTGATNLVVYEALLIGEAAGIHYRDALNMMRRVHKGGPVMIEQWENTFDPTGTGPMPHIGLNMYDKDLPLAGELARDLDLDVPVTEQLSRLALKLSAQAAAEPAAAGAQGR